MYQLTERTRELLAVLSRYSNNTKYTWIILNVVSLILISSIINEKFGGTNPRIEARHWNSNKDLIEGLLSDHGYLEESEHSEEAALKWRILNGLKSIDVNELEKLREHQLVEFESVSIPLIGVSIASRDVSFVGAFALLIIYLWYLLSVIKERSVLAQLIYPLVAKPTDDTAKKLWGHFDSNGNLDKKALKKTIALYRTEVLYVKEAISSKFLTLYSSSNRRLFEYFIIGALTFMPLVMLTTSVSLDLYWDFKKPFKETGKSFYSELTDYQGSIGKLSNKFCKDCDKSDSDFCDKLRLSCEELDTYLKTMFIKRAVSLASIFVLFGICFYDLIVARSMTRILTEMNGNPIGLDVEKYVDA